MDKKRKKNRFKRRHADGTYDFVLNKDIKRKVRLGMLDWYIAQLKAYEDKRKLK